LLAWSGCIVTPMATLNSPSHDAADSTTAPGWFRRIIAALPQARIWGDGWEPCSWQVGAAVPAAIPALAPHKRRLASPAARYLPVPRSPCMLLARRSDVGCWWYARGAPTGRASHRATIGDHAPYSTGDSAPFVNPRSERSS
jgi:hypothetical protein